MDLRIEKEASMLNKHHKSGQRGASLMECLVALFILICIGVTLVATVYSFTKGNGTARNQITAESLARIELEYVQSQPYNATNWTYTLPGGPYPAWWTSSHTNLPSGYTGYSITVSANSNLPGYNSALQKVTVYVTYNGNPVFSSDTYQEQ